MTRGCCNSRSWRNREVLPWCQRRTGLSEKFTVRKIRLNLEPTSYNPATVRKTRDVLKLSQPLFAKFLGVSVQTVRAWEQGNKIPSDMACQFLDEINANPACVTRPFLNRLDLPKGAIGDERNGGNHPLG